MFRSHGANVRVVAMMPVTDRSGQVTNCYITYWSHDLAAARLVAVNDVLNVAFSGERRVDAMLREHTMRSIR